MQKIFKTLMLILFETGSYQWISFHHEIFVKNYNNIIMIISTCYVGAYKRKFVISMKMLFVDFAL